MKKALLIIGVIAIFLIVSLIALVAVKDRLLKYVVIIGTERIIGTPAGIDKFSLNIPQRAIRIKGFKLYQPKGYPEGVLVDLPEISVDIDLPALLKKSLHLPQIVINLKELVVIKNKEGKLNVDSLKVARETEEPAKPEKEKPSAAVPMQIDVLTLTIGNVVYKDYSKGEKPSVEVFDVGIKERTYKNIKGATHLAALILSEALMRTTIKDAVIFGIAAATGGGFLEVGLAFKLIEKDSAQAVFEKDYEEVYNTSEQVMEQMGDVSKAHKDKGIIEGKLSGSNITIKVKQESEKNTKLTVSAREMMLPKPKVARSILYHISEKLHARKNK